MAPFVGPDIFNYYYIPQKTKDNIVSIGDNFNLEPLQTVIDQNKAYYVLAVSHKNTCLYEGDQYNLAKVNLPNFPTNMEKTLNIDEHQKCSETHTIAAPGAKGGSEAYHGQYNVSQTDKEMLLKFFQKIDKYLHSFLQKNQKPLILSGVDYLLPIYRKANTYSGLVDEIILGNQDHAKPQDIIKKAREIALG